MNKIEQIMSKLNEGSILSMECLNFIWVKNAASINATIAPDA